MQWGEFIRQEGRNLDTGRQSSRNSRFSSQQPDTICPFRNTSAQIFSAAGPWGAGHGPVWLKSSSAPADRSLSTRSCQTPSFPLDSGSIFGPRPPGCRRQPGEVLFLRQQFRLERLHQEGLSRSSLPGSFRTHEPVGRVLCKTLGIVHVFVVSSRSALHSLTQQIGHRQLRVLPS